jgi:outer membrane receptor protein involved in Fe transport
MRGVALALLLLIATCAHAQSATPGESDQLPEIIVTAQKRVEDVQQVPIAITAINSDTLQQRGVTSLAQLSNIAPNVNLDAGTRFPDPTQCCRHISAASARMISPSTSIRA